MIRSWYSFVEYTAHEPLSKQWQGLATRYDKTATIYLAALALAGISVRSAT